MGVAELSAERFRTILDAMARPGKILSLNADPPEDLSPAQAAIAMTLIDATQQVWVTRQTSELADWFGFHTGTRPQLKLEKADFVFATPDDFDALDACRIGNDEYPDQSATIIMELPELTNEGAKLTGPGIETKASLSLPELAFFQRNMALFPLGLDFMLTCGTQIACLPRSTKVEG